MRWYINDKYNLHVDFLHNSQPSSINAYGKNKNNNNKYRDGDGEIAKKEKRQKNTQTHDTIYT